MTRPMPLMLMLFLAIAGCGSGSRLGPENDRLRRENLELREANRLLTLDAQEARAKAAEAARASNLPPDVLDALPRAATIEIDRLSGPAWDPNTSPRQASLARVWVRPLDGRGRFVPVAGSLTIEIRRLPDLATPDAAAADASDQISSEVGSSNLGSSDVGTLLASRTLTPTQLRDAYVSLMGQAYRVDVPLTPAWDGVGTLVIRARLIDAVTTTTHDAAFLPPRR